MIKKLFKCLFTLTLMFLLAMSLTSCNDGHLKDLYGIYGITTFYYEDVNDNYYNFSDKVDYIVVVVKEDKTLDIYYKVAGGTEKVINTTYEVEYSTGDDKEKVSSIKAAKFIKMGLSSATSENPTYELMEIEDVTIRFANLVDSLKYNTSSLKKNKEGKLTFEHYKCHVKKMEKKITDKNLDKVKAELTKERTERSSNTSVEDDD